MLTGGVVDAGGETTGGDDDGGDMVGVCGGAIGAASLHAAAPSSAAIASDLERVFIAANLSLPSSRGLSRSMVVIVVRCN